MNYPKPDLKHTVKSILGLTMFWIFLHWVPEIATWIHSLRSSEPLYIEPRRFQAVVLVFDVMAVIAVTVNLAGLSWAYWHHRKPRS